ncbi:MAG: acetate--CoA ligase [Halanaeroarchaeum sp.]
MVNADPGHDAEETPGNADAYAPPPAFAAQANITEDPRAEWRDEWPAAWEEAADLLTWSTTYDRVLSASEPPLTWFPGGELNASANAIDRYVSGGRKNRVAIKWAGRMGETRTLTYQDLSHEVNALAAGLRDFGVGEDDVVTIYLPMVPELPVAMLAAARIGAPHNVVFAGFSPDALATRMASTESSFLVTADGYYRQGDAVHQKNRADNARLALDRTVDAVVIDRMGFDVSMDERDVSYEELIDAHAGETVDPVARGSADDLFIIHTSGTTGNPKAVRHTTGGYLAHVAWTTRAVLDVKPDDTVWSSADIGWITGHSYVVYGPLALGTTTMLYEGAPDHPRRDRVWELIERNAVDVFYTAPTAISAFRKREDGVPNDHDLSSLRLLGTVGEHISPGAWDWYRSALGDGTTPVVDTWWQTETGGMMIATLPGVDRMKPGASGPPLPGVEVSVVDRTGSPVSPGERGFLVVDRPWPGMPRSLADGSGWVADPSTYLVDLDDWAYVTGDRATVDEEGYVTVLGRVDDVVNVGGRRLETGELESAVLAVDGVAEAAVVSPAETAPASLYAFVTPATEGTAELRERIVQALEAAVGTSPVPVSTVFTTELPKTRSGKIMRRLLSNITEGEDLGDTSALRNPAVVGELKSILEEEGRF